MPTLRPAPRTALREGTPLERLHLHRLGPPVAIAAGGAAVLVGAVLVALGVIGGLRAEWPPISAAVPSWVAAALVVLGAAAMLVGPVLVAFASGRSVWAGVAAFAGGVAAAGALLAAVWAVVGFEAAAVAAPVAGAGGAVVVALGRAGLGRRLAIVLAVAVVGGAVAQVLGTGAERVAVACWGGLVVALSLTASDGGARRQ